MDFFLPSGHLLIRKSLRVYKFHETLVAGTMRLPSFLLFQIR